MTCIGEAACGGDWCGAPLSVWVELAALPLWLDPTAMVDILLAGWCSWTLRMSPKVECSDPLVMVERIWVVEGWRVLGGGWGLGVSLHLDGDVEWLIWMALS
jgi:hypothetical protein